jgi:hypothetical protein
LRRGDLSVLILDLDVEAITRIEGSRALREHGKLRASGSRPSMGCC